MLQAVLKYAEEIKPVLQLDKQMKYQHSFIDSLLLQQSINKQDLTLLIDECKDCNICS